MIPRLPPAENDGPEQAPGSAEWEATGRPEGGSSAEWGCVHGRFQPFHNEHLEYVLHAKERCRSLIVGITNPDPTWVRAEASSPHRHQQESNPFTYLQRALMVRDSLLAEGVRPDHFSIVPFPIHDPRLCRYYVPAGAVHFVRVYSGWEREKVHRLRAAGFAVEILDVGKEKKISGVEVRHRIRSGLPWEYLVPAGTAAVVCHTHATGGFGLAKM